LIIYLLYSYLIPPQVGNLFVLPPRIPSVLGTEIDARWNACCTEPVNMSTSMTQNPVLAQTMTTDITIIILPSMKGTKHKKSKRNILPSLVPIRIIGTFGAKRRSSGSHC
jgi:hypothetical protein